MSKGILYTSYYSNKHRKDISGFQVAISRYKPKWLDFNKEGILWYEILSPSKELLKKYKNGLVTEDKFRLEYLLQVSKNLECSKALESISKVLDNGTNIILLCYEKSNDFCHRHILAEIFNEEGYQTKEL